MSIEIITYGVLDSEIRLSFSRSSGPGGQSVNKLNTRAELWFNVNASTVLNEDQKELIHKKLKSRINNDGELFLSNQTERSQLKNKEIAIKRFYELINKALKVHKKRKPTKPSKASIEKRLQNKKQRSEKKGRRRKSDEN